MPAHALGKAAFTLRVVVVATSIAIALAAGLSGCASAGSHDVRSDAKAASHYDTSRSFAAPLVEWPRSDWWNTYGDPQLNALIDEALYASPTLAAAIARVQRAEAEAQVTGATLSPQLTANGSITEQKQSRNYLTPSALTPEGWKDYGRTTLDFTWELDFWGRNRAALAAATSEAEAARAEAAETRLVLGTAIASSYAELARLFAALDTARSAHDVRAKTAALFRERQANGLETLGSVRSAEARERSAEGDVLALEEQLARERNKLAALAGAGPDRGLSIVRPSASMTRPFGLPPRLSLDLLGRRPDIVAARLRAEAAAKRIDVAQAAFYPNVNLSAFIGLLALNTSMLTRAGSSFGSIGPAISLPIFDGGRLEGQLRGAKAEYREAVANYDRTVVQALQDVADAATSQRALVPQIATAGAATAAAREAWRIQNDRYRGGLATYLDVLSAEETLLASERSLTDLSARSLALDVALVRALGGGYQPARDS